jgi:poly(A) polymerase Pap1
LLTDCGALLLNRHNEDGQKHYDPVTDKFSKNLAFDSTQKTSYLCPKVDSIELFGDKFSRHFKYAQFRIIGCESNCADESMIDNLQVNILILNQGVDLEYLSEDEIIRFSVDGKHYINLDSTMTKSLDLYFQKNTVSLDDALNKFIN